MCKNNSVTLKANCNFQQNLIQLTSKVLSVLRLHQKSALLELRN